MRKLFWIWIATTLIHFFTTWYCSLAGWTCHWAYEIEKVLWFPGSHLLEYSGGGKLATMTAMLANSALWGLCLVILLACVGSLLSRREKQPS